MFAFKSCKTRTPHTRLILWCVGLLLCAPLSLAYGNEDSFEEEIETLEVIEITGSVVEERSRNLNFPVPEIRKDQLLIHHSDTNLSGPKLELTKSIPTHSPILLDQTAQTTNIHTPVKPLKTERPSYPRRAREQGWHGRVIVRLEISPEGTVQSSTIHKSSGYPLLDDGAIKATTQWTFQPAKNGAFPVATTVNIPIQFDLIK